MIKRTSPGVSFNFLQACESNYWYSLNTYTIPLLPTVGYTAAHTEDTTKATRSHSWLIYTAAIQMRIAEDVWWFSNLSSCHWEMGRADPCHPHSASQTAPHLHLNLPPLTISVHHCVVHLLSKCQHEYFAAASLRLPRVGVTCSAAIWYNVMLSLGKGSMLTCCVECAGWCMLSHNNRDPDTVCASLHGSLRATKWEDRMFWGTGWEIMRQKMHRAWVQLVRMKTFPENVSSFEFFCLSLSR